MIATRRTSLKLSETRAQAGQISSSELDEQRAGLTRFLIERLKIEEELALVRLKLAAQGGPASRGTEARR